MAILLRRFLIAFALAMGLATAAETTTVAGTTTVGMTAAQPSSRSRSPKTRCRGGWRSVVPVLPVVCVAVVPVVVNGRVVVSVSATAHRAPLRRVVVFPWIVIAPIVRVGALRTLGTLGTRVGGNYHLDRLDRFRLAEGGECHPQQEPSEGADGRDRGNPLRLHPSQPPGSR
ncbi:MAG: hypothetical protein GEV03_22520 [Streptosporangiales bacterium]|nr:hypothetical protein [Streptosporangiales bacterium]